MPSIGLITNQLKIDTCLDFDLSIIFVALILSKYFRRKGEIIYICLVKKGSKKYIYPSMTDTDCLHICLPSFAIDFVRPPLPIQD